MKFESGYVSPTPMLARALAAILALALCLPTLSSADDACARPGGPVVNDAAKVCPVLIGIAFRVDDATVSKYKDRYGIDLEADSGQIHHQLPVPSAFVVDGAGTIAFAYVNPDYKVRVNGEVLLAAAKGVGRGE